MKKYILKSVVAVLVLFSTINAKAYDVDTHFYGTYSLARFAGIRHEVAAKIATGAQWMDESYISDPLSMIILPDVGIKKRRLLHFPGTRVANKLTVSTLPSFLDPSSKVPLKSFTETEADHEFASEMINEGLMKGDLMMTATGLHTLEDSFAHAGTIAELGHAHFWHHPDRPYVDDASVEKYFLMCRSVLRAMVAIRSLIPANAIDTQVQFGAKPNYQLDGDQLADIYSQLPDVRKAISRRILNEPAFVSFALNDVFKRAQKVNYVKPGYENYLNNFTPGQDAYQAAANIAKSLPPEMINVNQIMKDSGRPVLSAEYIVSMGGMAGLLHRVINDLLTGIVPRPMDVFHRFEKEEDGPVWVKELEIRVGNMRALIKRLYNTDVYFVANNTSSQQGFVKEIAKDPVANPRLPAPAQGINYVTFSLAEKYKFNHMIFNFMFPKLGEYTKNDEAQVNQLAAFVISAEDATSSDSTLASKLVSLSRSSGGFWAGLGMLSDIPGLMKKISIAREDIMQSHIIPHENNRFYTVPHLLRGQITRKIYKPLMSNHEVEQLVQSQVGQ